VNDGRYFAVPGVLCGQFPLFTKLHTHAYTLRSQSGKWATKCAYRARIVTVDTRL